MKVDFAKIDFTFWCYSRRDVNLTQVKEEVPIITSFVEDYELQDLIFNQPFSISYRFNGSHYQCNVDELWNDAWFDKNVGSNSPCVTNTSLPINVLYHTTQDNKL